VQHTAILCGPGRIGNNQRVPVFNKVCSRYQTTATK
jgi:hypothetical protein